MSSDPPFEDLEFDEITSHLPNLCLFCRHGFSDRPACKAFPNGIPKKIMGGMYDHRYPYPNDNNIQFEKYERAEDIVWDRLKNDPEYAKSLLKDVLENLKALRAHGYILPSVDDYPLDD